MTVRISSMSYYRCIRVFTLRKTRSSSLSNMSDTFAVRLIKSSLPLLSAIVSSMKSNTVGSTYTEPSVGMYTSTAAEGPNFRGT